VGAWIDVNGSAPKVVVSAGAKAEIVLQPTQGTSVHTNQPVKPVRVPTNRPVRPTTRAPIVFTGPTISRAITNVTPLLGKVLQRYVPTAEEELDGRTQYIVDGTLLPCWSRASIQSCTPAILVVN
jgi:hypothetical protein